MIDVAKRLTAASSIGVGRAIYRVQLHAGCPVMTQCCHHLHESINELVASHRVSVFGSVLVLLCVCVWVCFVCLCCLLDL